MAATPPSAYARRLVAISEDVVATTHLLEHVAGLLRVLVQVVGWAVLVASPFSLVTHPNLSPEHLIPPSAGALAVLQSLIRPRQRSGGRRASSPAQETPEVGQPDDADVVNLSKLLNPGKPEAL
jgi:hypothetical protein